MQSSPKTRRLLSILLPALSLSGCGGGGGGGTTTVSNPPPPVYSGVLAAASLDSGNSDHFVLDLFDGSSIGGVTTASGDREATGNGASATLPAIQRLARGLSSLPALPAPLSVYDTGQISRAAAVNESLLCDTGTMTLTGQLDDTSGTGELLILLTACRLDGTLYEGQMTATITGADLQLGEITDARYSLQALQIEEASRRYHFAGNFEEHVSFTTNTGNLLLNLVFQDMNSGHMVKTENLSLVSQYDSLFNPLQADTSITGRIYDSRYGYVDITTTSLLHYDTLGTFPGSGEFLLTGAQQSHLAVTVLNGSDIELYLDEDGDALYEQRASKPWSLLGTTPVNNSAPVADAGLNRTVDKGSVVILNGYASSDPDRDYLSYHWQLTARPAGSQAALNRAIGVTPQLPTDLSGLYEVSLVVSDGQSSSTESRVTITALNTAPVADAGPNQIVLAGTSVTLDARGSSDRNGDALTYLWNLAGAPTGSTASITAADQSMASFTPEVPGLYTLTLVVNDSETDSAADSIVVQATDPASANLCNGDNVSALPASGSMLVDASQDFVPLCDGWLYFANRSSNSIDYLNVMTSTVARQYPLTGSPGDLELDADNGLLYATLAPTSGIARIDLINDQIATIGLTLPPLNLATGNGGRLFVAMDGGAWFQRPVAVVDGPGGTVVTTHDYTADYYLDFVVFDRQGNQLIGGDAGTSPSSLFRFSFDPSSDTLTHQETLRTSGANGQDLAIAPDGRRFAFPNGGGNGNGYTIFDYSSDALTTVFGEWVTGPYPSSAAFSPFGDRLVAGTYDSLKVFDVNTHTLLAEYPLEFSDCSYSQVTRVGISRGGRIAYAYSHCGFNRDSGKLFWVVIDG